MTRIAPLFALTIAVALAGCNHHDNVRGDTDDVAGQDSAAPAPSPSRVAPNREAPAAPDETPSESDGREFAGVFHLVAPDGTISVVRLAVRDQRITGTFDTWRIDAAPECLRAASGEFFHPTKNAAMGTVAMALTDDELTLAVAFTTVDPRTGERKEFPEFLFTRGAPPARAAAARPVASQPKTPERRGPAGHRDPDLIGLWKHTWQRVTPGGSIAGEVLLLLRADGTFEHGSGRCVGGTGDMSIESSGGEPARGGWRSTPNDDAIEVVYEGRSEWSHWASCKWTKGTVQLTFYDGDVQRYYRQ